MKHLFSILALAASILCTAEEFDIPKLLKMANAGDAKAQCVLGHLYEKGIQVKQNYEEAMYWFRNAAEQNLDVAQERLGEMYAHGNGTYRDYERAAYWYNRAANQEYWLAVFNLHVLSKFKMGVVGGKFCPEIADQLETTKKLAESGDAKYQLKLGLRYLNGYCIEKDHNQALTWIRKSAEQGFKPAQDVLKRLDKKLKPIKPTKADKNCISS